MPATSFAQSYKSRPIRFIVSTGPGTITDTVTRLIAQDLQDQLGQTIVVENRVGANGAIAARYVASASPDGLTFLVGNVSTHAANDFLYKTPTYNSQKDFVSVGLFGTVPQVLIVPKESPAKVFGDLVKLSKEKAGGLNFATASSLAIVVTDAITHAADINTTLIPFDATPQALNEMLAGRVDAIVLDLGVAKSFIEAGTVRALLVTLPDRTKLLPDVPSFADVGLPKLVIEGWFGLFGPTGTPQQAIDRLAAGIQTAANRETNQQKMAVYGTLLSGMGPKEFTSFVDDQRSLYQRLIKVAAIQIE
jgi:tripartite-type tricarboxylate transporter receptor subunit TctC